MAHTLSHRVTSEARALDQEVGPTITVALDDGPLRGYGLLPLSVDSSGRGFV
jgi:hypothetical protein